METLFLYFPKKIQNISDSVCFAFLGFSDFINEMNLYFTKVSDRLIKDKRPFNDRNAVKIMEFVNSRKPENVHFKVPLIKSDYLKSILIR